MAQVLLESVASENCNFVHRTELSGLVYAHLPDHVVLVSLVSKTFRRTLHPGRSNGGLVGH